MPAICEMATFGALFDQEAAVRALQRALATDHLAGSYLLTGAPGTGKGAVARAFAQAAACLQPRTDPFDACGVCGSCRRAEVGTQPEIVTITPAGDQMQIWQFWERENRPEGGILSRTLHYAPAVGRRRVFLLENAETLNEAAANSLLKVLEEPPPYVVFLLLAPHPARLLPTLVSRSQIVRLRAVPVEALAAYLRTSRHQTAERALMLAAYTEGRIGQAVRLVESPVALDEIAQGMAFAETLPEAPRTRALRAAEQMRKLAGQMSALPGGQPAGAEPVEETEGSAAPKERVGRRQLAAVFDLLIVFYRDLLALRCGGSDAKIVNGDRIAAMTRLAACGEPERWLACLDSILLARRRLEANANTALVTEVLATALLRG